MMPCCTHIPCFEFSLFGILFVISLISLPALVFLMFLSYHCWLLFNSYLHFSCLLAVLHSSVNIVLWSLILLSGRFCFIVSVF